MDTLKAAAKNGALWTAIIAGVVGTVLYLKPEFPRELLGLYVAIVVALLTALGVKGVTAVNVATRAIQTSRARALQPNVILGQVAFNAYAKAMNGKTYDGKPIPQWNDLSKSVQNGWAEAEKASRA
jgi:hypothetical protein